MSSLDTPNRSNRSKSEWDGRKVDRLTLKIPMYGNGEQTAIALTIAPLLTLLSSFILTQLRTYKSPPPGTPLGGRSEDGTILARLSIVLGLSPSSSIVVETDRPEWEVWPR